MVGHSSVAPYLQAMLGRQCQLRSFRAHINPGAYTQEWHKDFGYYWDAPDEARHALRPLCINTTFYLTDNAPETGRLTFINNFCHNALPEEIRHLGGYNSDNPFYQWCEQQEHIHLHPHDRRRGGVLQPHPAPGARSYRKMPARPSAATWCCTTSRRPCSRGFPLSVRRCRPLPHSGTTGPFRL